MDQTNDRGVNVMHNAGSNLYRFTFGNIQPAGIIGAGHQIATDSKGNIYVAATNRGLQKLVFKGVSAPPTR